MSSIPQDFMFFMLSRCSFYISLHHFFCVCKESAICKMKKMSWKRLKETSKTFRAHHSFPIFPMMFTLYI